MDLHLKGVHVLVTGASGGIGVETVKLFLEQGAFVTAQYNTTVDTLVPIGDAYPSLRLTQADVTSEHDVNKLFAQIDPHNPVQILVLNHGLWPTADVPMADMTLAQWDKTISTNLTSNFLLTRGFLTGLKSASRLQKDAASVILIGSTAGKYGEANHADYASAKSAVMYGFTLSLKNEIVKIAPKARVNCVAPGWVKTPMAEEALKDRAVVYRSIATTPLKKFASARDIANQIVILASPSVSGHVSGQVVMVEGGMEGRLLNMPEDVELPS
ncbi:NAD dependent epimerase/dehydratase [Hysterangium stoloniferum]|nr:NAD dependent epimerase/dehydratase [Hysterangium stoloniferum]